MPVSECLNNRRDPLKYPEKAQLNADAEHNDGDHNEEGVVLHGTKIP